MSLRKNKEDLFNSKYNGNKEEHLLRQYELFVESSEKISSKRMTANRFYLGMNTFLFAVAGYLSVLSRPLVVVILASIGILLSLSWISNLASYKRLNEAKFKVIFDLEERLPARVFRKEDEYLNSYYNLTKLEKYIPHLFIILYAASITFFLPQLIEAFIRNINLGV